MIKTAVLGYGTVGSGVVEVFETNKELIAKRVGEEIEVKYVLDLRDFPGMPIQEKIVHDVNIILEDEEIKVISETMGGIEPAYTFSKKALSAGKSVCTSNKELVEAHGPELIKLAKENHCSYLFEASVGGGIPIIRPFATALTADKVESVTGILNGTTNYILTKMATEGADFADVLREAQEKGYAEKDPTADVEGHDAGRKIAILSSLMAGKTVRFSNIYTEGISKITATDFLYANKMGRVIKLLGMSKEVKGKYAAMVAPFMISATNPLYAVNDVFNAICVHGNMLGDAMFYGKGAGKLPTASAVAGDVIDCARNLGKTAVCVWDEEEAQMADIEELNRRFFVRISRRDCDEKSVEAVFGKVQIITVSEKIEEFAVLTEVMTEKEYKEKAAKINGIISRIRVEE